MESKSSLLRAVVACLILAVANGFMATKPIGSSSTETSFALRSSQQPEYGTSLELPETYANCGRCDSSYAMKPEDLGEGKGRRLECSVCGHSWFQSRDRLLTMNEGFEMVPLSEMHRKRIETNMEEGKSPKFTGYGKLYVGNISFQSSEAELFEVFAKVGEVGDVSLVRDEIGRNRGFGFITMRKREDGDKAMTELDGFDLHGRKLAVRESNS